MKTNFLLLMCTLGLKLSSQTLSNTDFEIWNNPNDPAGWYSLFNFGEKTTDSHSGTYAAKISSVMMCGIAEGILANGVQPNTYNIIDGGTPCGFKPTFLTGFYKYTNTENGDTATATVILKKYNTTLQKADTVAFGTTKLFASAGYVLFNVTVADLKPNVVPDSILVVFQSGTFYNPNDTSANPFPILQIDDIRLGGASSVDDQDNEEVTFSNLYPNPFSQTAHLKLNAPVDSYDSVRLVIYNAEGKEVSKVNEFINGGFLINRGILPEGIYNYSVIGDEKVVFNGKFIINN